MLVSVSCSRRRLRAASARPPPDIDVEAWHEDDRRDRAARARPARAHPLRRPATDVELPPRPALVDPGSTAASSCVEDGMDEETFIAAARYDVAQTDPELVDDYQRGRRRTGTTSAASSATGASGREAAAATRPATRAPRGRRARRTRAPTRGSPRERRAERRRPRAPPASAPRRRTSGRPAARPGEHPLRLRASTRSLPAVFENSRNSSVITAHTAWKPGSRPSVRQ